MRKIWAVVRREFLERVRTRWFVLWTALGPVLLAAMMLAPVFFAERGGGNRSIVVLDASSDAMGEQLVALLNQTQAVHAVLLAATPLETGRVADSLTARIGLDALDGVLIVSDGVLEGSGAEYRGSNTASPSDMRVLQAALRTAVFGERLRRAGVDPRVVAGAQVPVELATVTVREGRATGASGEATFFLAYVMWFLLYVAILLYGIQVMGSVVEEKTTRMVEVLISSLKPFHLLTGKIVGVGSVGLFQLGIWVGFAKLLLDRRADLAGLLGKGGEQAALGGMSLPDVPLGTIVVFLTYFVLGYFLFAAMFGAVAAMTNSESEARQAQTPVVMLLVVPTVMMVGILNNPDGSLAVAMSLIPFTAPIGMPVRWAATAVPAGQLGGSLALLLLTIVGVMWVAGRIYRVGVLMYGKRPTLLEVLRWVRG